MSTVQYDGATGLIVAFGTFDSAPAGLLLGYVLDDAPLYQPGIKRLVGGVVQVQYVAPDPLPYVALPGTQVLFTPDGTMPTGDTTADQFLLDTSQGMDKTMLYSSPKGTTTFIRRANITALQAAVAQATPRTDALEAWRDNTAKPALATLATQTATLNDQLTALTARVAALEVKATRSATRTVTSLLLTAPVAATLTWDTPFSDTTYKATASVVGGTAATTATVRITTKTTTGCTISVTGGLLGGTAIIDALAVP